jgi:hypothetical protein
MNSQHCLRQFLILGLSMLATSCANMFGNTTATSPLQLVPSSTTVGVNQSMAFQIIGGTPPYSFSDAGVGSVDSSGNYNSGGSSGNAQVNVTDANGNSAYASVSVVTYGSSVSTAGTAGWSAVDGADPTANSWVHGQLVGVDDHSSQTGNTIQSKFLVTQLKHPLVRMDALMDGQSEVATRALVEDQFLVKLQKGYSDADLSSILTSEGAHISRKLSSGAYLVSMAQAGEVNTSGISSDFVVKRERLKQELKTIAVVTPHFLSRVPASVPAGVSNSVEGQ